MRLIIERNFLAVFTILFSMTAGVFIAQSKYLAAFLFTALATMYLTFALLYTEKMVKAA